MDITKDERERALGPCPFCGGTNLWKEWTGEFHFSVGCEDCDIALRTFWDGHRLPNPAIAAWNKRATTEKLAALEEENARLRKEQEAADMQLEEMDDLESSYEDEIKAHRESRQRIERLEAALREIANCVGMDRSDNPDLPADIARAALTPDTGDKEGE